MLFNLLWRKFLCMLLFIVFILLLFCLWIVGICCWFCVVVSFSFFCSLLLVRMVIGRGLRFWCVGSICMLVCWYYWFFWSVCLRRVCWLLVCVRCCSRYVWCGVVYLFVCSSFLCCFLMFVVSSCRVSCWWFSVRFCCVVCCGCSCSWWLRCLSVVLILGWSVVVVCLFSVSGLILLLFWMILVLVMCVCISWFVVVLVVLSLIVYLLLLCRVIFCIVVLLKLLLVWLLSLMWLLLLKVLRFGGSGSVCVGWGCGVFRDIILLGCWWCWSFFGRCSVVVVR